MNKKLFTLIFTLLMLTVLNSNSIEAQTTKTKAVFPQFSISPVGGIQFPIGGLNDNYNVSFNAGLDLCLRINKETAFYLNGTYYNMPRKPEVSPGGDASYIAITAGPRYFFASTSIKALFFLEAGAGAYILNIKEYITPGTPGITIASSSVTSFGGNAGPGVIIPLGKSMDLIVKSKIHYIFQKGGDRVFIGTALGLNFDL